MAQEHKAAIASSPPFQALDPLYQQVNHLKSQKIDSLKLHQAIDKFQLYLNHLDEAIFKTYLRYHLPDDTLLPSQ